MLQRTIFRPALPWLFALALAAGCGDGGATGGGDVSGRDVPDNPDPPRSSFTAEDHVSGAEFSKLTIEVDFVTQRGPDGTALSELQAALDQLRADGQLAKPGGVEFVLDDVLDPSPADKVWTLGELQALAQGYRDHPLDATAAAIHVLYVDGHYQDDTAQGTVLGFAYGGSWMVMFKDNITDACASSTVISGPVLSGLRDKICSRAEATVLLHELGHLFGLVNNGTPMVVAHEDPDHAKHDADKDCLMYWAIERSTAVDIVAEGFVGGTPQLGFCATSLADLEAVASPGQ
ncbi:MAG: hypothetical protein CVU56_24390 [Deltaproteobacteria bacterium HGW-Deltaproteobacteria-14]|jgi:hypothetical protein|nr:MAG: hypothetical protein CVU56_24390 [Deltaproteobacteria bacterium HGW-Deltaproteobacteria-14]